MKYLMCSSHCTSIWPATVPSYPNAIQRHKKISEPTQAIMKMSRSFIALLLAVLFASMLLAVRHVATVPWSRMISA